MEGFTFNKQEANTKEVATAASELVTDPEQLAELVAEAKETKERMEEIPEEDEQGRLWVRNRDDYDAIEAEAKRLTELLSSIPDSVKLQHGLPANFHPPEAAHDDRAPLRATG